jgi:1,4-alpha-glucan branching enzyme
MAQGTLCIFLHTHLPFVRHPENAHHLEEQWLREAITESYIPLLTVFEQCVADGVPFRMTMSLTPTLVSMLQDDLLKERYVRHLDKLIELAELEIRRTAALPEYRETSLMYHDLLAETKEKFVSKYSGDLVSAFKRLQDLGRLEIVASCATHGFLPNIAINSGCALSQIHLGVDHYEKTFGKPPRGFWLPECGYYKDVDEILKDAGIGYFFLDSHGIVNAQPRPKYSVYAPIFCPSGVAAFGRDWECSKQVWSAQEGYPGDPEYREFYRDIGHELDLEYIKPYIHPDNIRINTGFKYWRITGKTEQKEPYRQHLARDKAACHAADFLQKRQGQIGRLSELLDRKPIVVAPYDAELFGHWWYEGPQWLDFLIRKIAFEQDVVEMGTPSEYLKQNPTNQRCMPPLSSWGYKGYSEYWLDSSNDWLYRHLHHAGGRMCELAASLNEKKWRDGSARLVRRACNQAARELLLAESSDWPFILKTGTMAPYADKRVKQHIGRFTKLYDDICASTIDETWLSEVESRDNIFADMDCVKYYACDGENKGKKRAEGKRDSRRVKK